MSGDPYQTPLRGFPGGWQRPRGRREVPAALGLFVVVLLSLQVFLLTVGVDALLADDDGLAWVTGGLSVLLAAGAASFYRYLR
ncbi:MAG: hypothetical protein ACRD0O_04945 [Acidimicrobiia bacterium]